MYALVDMGGGIEVLKLYVEEIREVVSNNTIKRSYQLQNITKAPVVSAKVQGSSLSPFTSTASANIYKVADLFNFVNRNDKNFNPKPVNPELLNGDGTPKKFYHGTNASFNVFEKGVKNGWLGKGIYAAGDVPVLSSFAPI